MLKGGGGFVARGAPAVFSKPIGHDHWRLEAVFGLNRQ
jgi:hypothetical protein